MNPSFILSGESFEEANEVEGRRVVLHFCENMPSFDCGLKPLFTRFDSSAQDDWKMVGDSRTAPTR